MQINSAPTAQAFTPSVHVRANGTIGVTYYDFRSNTADPATLPTELIFARSTDGVTLAGESIDCRIRHAHRAFFARVIYRRLPRADER